MHPPGIHVFLTSIPISTQTFIYGTSFFVNATPWTMKKTNALQEGAWVLVRSVKRTNTLHYILLRPEPQKPTIIVHSSWQWARVYENHRKRKKLAFMTIILIRLLQPSLHNSPYTIAKIKNTAPVQNIAYSLAKVLKQCKRPKTDHARKCKQFFQQNNMCNNRSCPNRVQDCAKNLTALILSTTHDPPIVHAQQETCYKRKKKKETVQSEFCTLEEAQER